MKVLMICGSYPPENCGVGDYTYQLVNAFEDKSVNIQVLANIDWRIRSIFKTFKMIKVFKPDLLHIQYPSFNYGLSLVPQILSLLFKSIVTLHEISKLHPLRKLSLLPFSISARIIVTNRFEKNALFRLFFWRSDKNTFIIPIGSNIQMNPLNDIDSKKLNIVHFGQIRDNKGLEDVLALAYLLKKNNLPNRIIIAGQVLSKYDSYYKSLRDKSTELCIDWFINLPEEKISQLLADNLIAYFPYPDGASERRGSLLAALNNLMFVITTKGEQTTDELLKVVRIIDHPLGVLDIISSEKIDLITITKNMETAMKSYMFNLNWGTIASKHISLYKNTSR